MKAAIGSLPQDRVQPRFLLTAASDITRSDIDLAFASDGIIIGFNIEPSEAVLAAAKQYGESEPESASVPIRAITSICIQHGSHVDASVLSMKPGCLAW